MFGARTSEQARKGEEENPFLLSFSDLMASLLAIFILALIVMMIQLHLQKKELERERENIRVTREELLERLKDIRETQDSITRAIQGINVREQSLSFLLKDIQDDLAKRGIRVLVAENGSVLRIPEDALHFQLGRFEIHEEFRPAAEAIGMSLLNALSQKQNLEMLDTVFIEGHTDDVPNAREMGNWGLSTYRAISLWQFWTEEPGTCVELKNLKTAVIPGSDEEKPLISVSGYAETRPTGVPAPELEPGQTGNQGNPSDRRIDIRFTLTSSERENLEELKGKVTDLRTKTQDLIERLEMEK